MAKIKKIQENGVTIYPATITNAIKDPKNGKNLGEELDGKVNYDRTLPNVVEIGSLTTLYPEAGIEYKNMKKDSTTRARFIQTLDLPLYISVKDGYSIYHGIYFDGGNKTTGKRIDMGNNIRTLYIPKQDDEKVSLIFSTTSESFTDANFVEEYAWGNALVEKEIMYSGKTIWGGIDASTLTLVIESPQNRVNTSFFELNDTKAIKLNANDYCVKIGIAFYDVNYQPKGYQSKERTEGGIYFEIPEDAAFCRLWFTTKVVDESRATYYSDIDATITCITTGKAMREMNKCLPITRPNTHYSDYIIYTTKKANKSSINVFETNVSEPVKMSEETLYGMGYVYLPKSYSAEGKPTRLIIFGNGSGSAMTSDFSETYKPIANYLCAQGYAVAATTYWLGTDKSLGSSGNIYNEYGANYFGTPTNYAIYSAFYSKVMELYNFLPEVFLFGKSQGGLQVVTIPYVTNIPVIASCFMAGVWSPLENMFGYIDRERILNMRDFSFSGMEMDENGNLIGEAKVMLYQQEGVPNYGEANAYTMTEDRREYLLKQADKLRGYMAGTIHNSVLSVEDYINHYKSDTTEQWEARNEKVTNAVPTLFVCAKDDAQYKPTLEAYQAYSRGNNICRMRVMPSGMENPHQAVDKLAPKITVNTLLEGEMDVAVNIAEMLEFFQNFE